MISWPTLTNENQKQFSFKKILTGIPLIPQPKRKKDLQIAFRHKVFANFVHACNWYSLDSEEDV